MTGELRVMLTGATGFLGSFLSAELRRRRVGVVTGGRTGCDVELDLSRPDGVAEAVSRVSPDRVLHAAALSSVGACAADPDLAEAVNSRATGRLAEAVGRSLVLVSTDLVFDGRSAPYRPGDRPAPVSVYGSSKAAAERLVLAAGGAVVRVPLLFGPSPDGSRGATDMLRWAIRERRVLDLFTDEYRTPLHARDAAAGLVDLVLDGSAGVFHLTGPERVSRWELGERFCRVHGLASGFLRPVPRPESPVRPADVSLVGRVCGPGLDEALRLA